MDFSEGDREFSWVMVTNTTEEPNALWYCFYFLMKLFFTDLVPCSWLIDAHPQSQITGIAWLDNNTIVSVGQDCNSRYWDIRNFPWNWTNETLKGNSTKSWWWLIAITLLLSTTTKIYYISTTTTSVSQSVFIFLSANAIRWSIFLPIKSSKHHSLRINK